MDKKSRAKKETKTVYTENDITAIKSFKLFQNRLKVKRIGKQVFHIIGFNYGEEEIRFTGFAKEVAECLNDYFRNFGNGGY